jgi:hypothetical protein
MTPLSPRQTRAGVLIVVVVVVVGVGLWVATLLPIADPLPAQLQGWRTVGSYFDRPPAYPGKPWTLGDRTVDSTTLEAIAGPSHCGWDSVTFLFVGWPIGTDAINASHGRQYIRDTRGTLQGPTQVGTWAKNPQIPPDARDTGYRYGAVKLYLAPSDQDVYAYLIAPADSERWPRSDPMLLCS